MLCSFDSLILFAARHLNLHRAATTSAMLVGLGEGHPYTGPTACRRRTSRMAASRAECGGRRPLQWYDGGATAMPVSSRNLRSIRRYHLQIVRDRLF